MRWHNCSISNAIMKVTSNYNAIIIMKLGTGKVPFPRYQQCNSRSFSRNVSMVTTDSNNVNPWKEVIDPNGSGLVYYWNPQTNETTALGKYSTVQFDHQ